MTIRMMGTIADTAVAAITMYQYLTHISFFLVSFSRIGACHRTAIDDNDTVAAILLIWKNKK